jgi:hypothetical protein
VPSFPFCTLKEKMTLVAAQKSAINTKPESRNLLGAFQNHLLISSCPSVRNYLTDTNQILYDEPALKLRQISV